MTAKTHDNAIWSNGNLGDSSKWVQMGTNEHKINFNFKVIFKSSFLNS